MFKAERMHGAIHRFDRLFDAGPVVKSGPDRTAGPMPSPARKTPLVGLIRNPRSHRNGGADAGNGILKDADAAPGASRVQFAQIITHAPSRRGDLAGILTEFARRGIDYLAIDGGDGTVRDVLTCGARVFGEDWPALIILPRGKTNALAYDLAVPENWTLEEALEAVRGDRTIMRRPLVVTQTSDGIGGQEAQMLGFVLGGGAYTAAVALGQEAHGLGAFGPAVVGVTAAWGLAQMLLGRAGNAWRRGTPMRLRHAGGSELPHAGGGPLSERYFLFASTLERMPAGLRPFGDVDGPLRLATLDNARRSLLVRLPLIFMGRAGKGTRRLGYHALSAEGVELDIGDRFVLDGESFPAGTYRLGVGPWLRFVVP